MLHQVQQAVHSGLNLSKVLQGWSQISADLAQRPRQRALQACPLSQRSWGKSPDLA